MGTADCPAGKKVLGGGASTDTTSRNQKVSASYPKDEGTWEVTVDNAGLTGTLTFKVYAVCATVAP